MTDVCPFTLGVEIMRNLGDRKESGHFMPVIHRNTTIPVSREERVFTVEPWQRCILVKVFQGDGRRVESNVFLGELNVADLPVSEKPVEVLLRFSYDVSGLLEVEAVVPATGKRCSTVITKHAGGLAESDLRAALEKLRAVKFFPRDELENRRLTLFAERIVPELPLVLRDELVVAIDGYEWGLHERRPARALRVRSRRPARVAGASRSSRTSPEKRVGRMADVATLTGFVAAAEAGESRYPDMTRPGLAGIAENLAPRRTTASSSGRGLRNSTRISKPSRPFRRHRRWPRRATRLRRCSGSIGAAIRPALVNENPLSGRLFATLAAGPGSYFREASFRRNHSPTEERM